MFWGVLVGHLVVSIRPLLLSKVFIQPGSINILVYFYLITDFYIRYLIMNVISIALLVFLKLCYPLVMIPFFLFKFTLGEPVVPIVVFKYIVF